MNRIIIFAKHPNLNKEYVFAVPYYMDVRKGNTLLVETSKGAQVAIATSDIIECENADEIAVRYGAYLPLKPVINCVNDQLVNFIKSQAKLEIKKAVDEAFLKDEMPF